MRAARSETRIAANRLMMTEVSCIFCGKQNRHVAITEKGFTGVRCAACEVIYISPRPNADQVLGLYTDTHAVMYADAQFMFEDFSRMEAARTLSKIATLRKSGCLLELGAGGGSFLSQARSFGYEPFAIELNPIEAKWIGEKLGFPCESQPLGAQSFGGKRFDIIYHRDVLSHLSDPIGALADMNRALKKNGLLVFETGNIGEVNPKYLKYFSQFSYPDHLFFFGEKSLRMLLEQTGFQCLDVRREGILLPLLLQKALWSVKDSLKDKEVIDGMRQRADAGNGGMSAKRRLRLLYRYATHYLHRAGAFLNAAEMPTKLLVCARKTTA